MAEKPTKQRKDEEVQIDEAKSDPPVQVQDKILLK